MHAEGGGDLKHPVFGRSVNPMCPPPGLDLATALPYDSRTQPFTLWSTEGF